MRALNNAADESLQLALWVKIDEKKDHHPIRQSSKMYDDLISHKTLFNQINKKFSLIFMQDSGIRLSLNIKAAGLKPTALKKKTMGFFFLSTHGF